MTRDDIIRMAREADREWDTDYTGRIMVEFLEEFAALVAAAEREKVAQWMIQRSYATGHGDTIEDLLEEMEWQVRESERKAILKKADSLGWVSVDDIRARGEA